MKKKGGRIHDLIDFGTDGSKAKEEWTNLGGQLVTTADLDTLRSDICNGALDSWTAIHDRYNELWARYPADKLHHALHALCSVLGTDKMNKGLWLHALAQAESIERHIAGQVYVSRKKDHNNPYRSITCRNTEEMLAIYGKAEENGFVNQMREEAASYTRKIELMKESINECN